MLPADVTLGVPGAGKTSRLLALLSRELERGVPAERIAFVTFTRAARAEAKGRVRRAFGLGEEALTWFRTVHSAAFRLLELNPGRIMGDEACREFARKFGYQISGLPASASDPDLDPIAAPRRTLDDLCRFVYDWGRNRRLDAGAAARACPVEGLRAEGYRRYVQHLERFKRGEGLLDFCDLLEDVLRAELRPDVEVAFIDEAQDLSPLQIAVCELWFDNCERVYVAGDDDQAVYGFQGADAEWLRTLAASRPTEILDQSHRVPRRIQRFADAIIRRNRRRVEKQCRPASRDGSVVSLDWEEALELAQDGTPTFVLARNRIFLQPLAKRLFEKCAPYVVEGDVAAPNPLGDERLLSAIEIGERLIDLETVVVPAADVRQFLEFVPTRGGPVAWGSKTRLEAAAKDGRQFAWSELREEFGLGSLLDRMVEAGPLAVMDKAPARSRTYIERLIRRHGSVPEPALRLMTIHASKGREAERVLLLPDQTKATAREYLQGRPEAREAENRVFYVGATRAKESLVLVRPRSRRFYDMPRVASEPCEVTT